jgi:hypothetical protein
MEPPAMRVFLGGDIKNPASRPTKVDVKMALVNPVLPFLHMNHSDHETEKTIQELQNMAAVYERRGRTDKAQQLHNLIAHLQLRFAQSQQAQVQGNMAYKPDAV